MPGLPLLTNEWLVLNWTDADDSSFHHQFFSFWHGPHLPE
jgi:hypothetical protein